MPKSNGLVSVTRKDGGHNITVSANYNRSGQSVTVTAGRWGYSSYHHEVSFQLQRFRNYGGGWTNIDYGYLGLHAGSNKDVHAYIGNVARNGTQLRLRYQINRIAPAGYVASGYLNLNF